MNNPAVEAAHKWHEFIEDNFESHPSENAQIMVEFSNGKTAPARYRRGAGLDFLGERPEGIGAFAEVQRWRYLELP
jgi:hypothetical protein